MMSSFDPHSRSLTPQEWKSIAHDAIDQADNSHTVVIGGFLGMLAGAAVSPITGILVFAWFGWKAWSDSRETDRNDAAVDTYGCVAHVLKGENLHDFAAQVGEVEVCRQIGWAIERGYRVSADAQEFMSFRKSALPPADAVEAEATSASPPLDFLANEIDALAAAPTTAIPESDHNDSPVESVELPEDASSADRPAAPSLAQHVDPRQRMAALLKVLADQGFPIGSLLNHPFVWCWGRSQSGKTSIALLLAFARMALGGRVSYATTDGDYPRDACWQRVDDTPEGYSLAIAETAGKLGFAAKNGLIGQSWVFDEMYAASEEHGIKIQPLLRSVLRRGSKTKGSVIGISQVDTSTAHGLRGIDDAWRDERVSIQAVHIEDEVGERRPTGQYIVVRGGDRQEWTIPHWMLSETNEYGQLDPLVWLLKQFPEIISAHAETPEKKSETVSPFQGVSNSVEMAETTEFQDFSGVTTADISNFISRISEYEIDETTLKRVRTVLEMKRRGASQTEIIFTVWGAKPGKTKAYEAAIDEYRAILDRYGKGEK